MSNDQQVVVYGAQESLRKYTMISYALHLLGLVNGLTFIAALILAYIKRDDARGTLYENHFAFQTRSFWWFVFWFIVALLPTMLTIGFIPFFVLPQIWFGYRMIKGWIRLSEGREVR